MSVTLSLTTRQEPVFNKAMREAKLKVASEKGTVELTQENFELIADAVMGSYLRATLSASADEDDFMHIANKIAHLEHHFNVPAYEPEVEEVEETPVVEEVVVENKPTKEVKSK